MTSVYIVTMGEYSDYHIHSVWSTEEQAQRVAALFTRTYDRAEVEEWDIDHLPTIYQTPRWDVTVRTDGQATIEPATEYDYPDDPDEDDTLNVVTYTDPNLDPDEFHRAIWYRDDVAYYTVLVAAPTKEQAMKAALDRIARYRAVEQGIADGGVVDEDGARADPGLPLIGEGE